ncbi:MAG: PEGA domain-containing protein [bacterium]
MSKNLLKKLLLIGLTLCFFTGITIFVIIITRGGMITKEGIIESGVVKITIEPQNIDYSVYINDNLFKVVNQRINNLEEGKYTMKIVSKGFTSWEKDIKITSGLVTELNVQLFPEKFSLNQVTKSNIDQAFFSKNGEYVYYVIKQSEFGNEKGIWRLKLTNNQLLFANQENSPEKISDIITPLTAAIASGKYKLIPSINNEKVVFADLSTNAIYILDATKQNSVIADNLIKTLKFTPTNINWFDGANSLILNDKNLLVEYSLSNNEITVIHYSQDGNLVFGIANSVIFYSDPINKQVFQYKNKVSNQIILSNATLPENITFISAANTDNSNLIIATTTDYYYVNLDKSIIKKITDSSYQLLSSANDSLGALFNKENQLYAFNIKETIATSTISVEATLISDTFNQANDSMQYVPSDTHLIMYQNANKIVTIMENDGANKLILLSDYVLKNPTFQLNSNGKTFFILLNDATTDTTTSVRSNLYKLNLAGN